MALDADADEGEAKAGGEFRGYVSCSGLPDRGSPRWPILRSRRPKPQDVVPRVSRGVRISYNGHWLRVGLRESLGQLIHGRRLGFRVGARLSPDINRAVSRAAFWRLRARNLLASTPTST